MKTLTAIILILTLIAGATLAQVPNLFNYQGRLTDAEGTPLDGNIVMRFTLYNELEEGEILWTSEEQEVKVYEGLFSYVLGQNVPIPEELTREYQTLYLGIAIEGEEEISPRVRLTSSAYAQSSGFAWDIADDIVTPAKIADNAVRTEHILNGSITLTKLNQSGATDGQGIRWDQTFMEWLPSDISSDCKWNILDSVLYTNNYWGIARGNAGNILDGDSIHTHVNLGVACTTGATSYDWYCTIGGGFGNRAYKFFTTVCGGSNNFASGGFNTIGGGSENKAYGYSGFIGGGKYNVIRGQWSVIGGGGSDDPADSNLVDGDKSIIGGGVRNKILWDYGFIGGGSHNTVDGSAGTIGGGASNETSGQYSTVAGGHANYAAHNSSTIGGGSNNQTNGQYSSIGGGWFNTTDSSYGVVCGGQNNYARGRYAAVLGGYQSTAGGFMTIAAGSHAKANHNGSVVISANSGILGPDSIRSGGSEQMVLRADGGLYITNTSELAPYDNSNIITTRGGAYLSGDGTTWTNSSDRARKENFSELDYAEILRKIENLPIQSWNYINENPNTVHIGPVAQDFYDLFRLGYDDKHISTVDADGVALAAIKQLISENKELRQRLSELEETVRKLCDEDQGSL